MRLNLRWADPVALYMFAIYGVLLALLPDELREESAWALPIWGLLLCPWPGYRLNPSEPAWQSTRSAEMFFVSILGIVWLFGILGTSTLLQFGPKWIAQSSEVAILELEGKISEAHALVISPTDFKSLVYVGSPKEAHLNVSPATEVFSKAAEDHLSEFHHVVRYLFLLGLIVACATLFVIGSVRIVPVTPIVPVSPIIPVK
jgi:hypothetical protein